jgi:hypothetical protein
MSHASTTVHFVRTIRIERRSITGTDLIHVRCIDNKGDEFQLLARATDAPRIDLVMDDSMNEVPA